MRRKARLGNPGFLAGLILAAAVCLFLPHAVYAGTREETIAFAFLVDEMGLNPAAACGVMGNISAETDFRADITGLGGAYGICQWMGSRKSSLISYCSGKGLDYRTIKGQLSFLKYELKNSFPGVFNYLKKVPNTAQGAYDAGYHLCYDFEIPGDRHNASVYRGKLARDTFWPTYGKNAMYLTGTDSLNGPVLTWTGLSGTKCTVLRAAHGKTKYKIIGRTKKGTFTDSTAAAGNEYDYMICPTSHETKRNIRSNVISVKQRYYISSPDCKITLGATSCYYNGHYRRPAVTVKYGNKTLKENTDFSVTCRNNKDAGTAVMTIAGTGKYAGKVNKYYTIKKAPQVITASDFQLPVSNTVVNIPLSVKGDGAVSCTSSVYAVAYARDARIVAKKPGSSTVTIKAAATKNYLAAEKKVTLTVVPPAPVITRGKIADAGSGKINVGIFWTAASDRDGYVFKYMLGSAAKRIVITDPSKAAYVIHGLARGYRWSFQVCSYKVINKKRCYSPWSNVWTVPL